MTRSTLGAAFSFVMSMLLAATPSSADFVNGGFETGDMTGWTFGEDNFDRGVAMEGADLTDDVSFFYQETYVTVHSGDYAAYAIGGYTAGEYLSLSQSVELAAGPYEVGFWVGLDAANSQASMGITAAQDAGDFAVYVNSVRVDDFTSAPRVTKIEPGPDPEDMEQFTAMFQATAGTNTIEIRVGGGGTGRAGYSIDDITLQPVVSDGLEGDYNGDNIVDAADYAVWRNSNGAMGVDPYSGADGDGDGDITPLDYDVWRLNYGMSTTPEAAVSAQPAPEPAAAVLCGLCALGALNRGRRG